MSEYRFRCECGCEFDEPDEVPEYRGECWGTPSYETMYYCPECGNDCFYDVELWIDEEEKDD